MVGGGVDLLLTGSFITVKLLMHGKPIKSLAALCMWIRNMASHLSQMQLVLIILIRITKGNNERGAFFTLVSVNNFVKGGNVSCKISQPCSVLGFTSGRGIKLRSRSGPHSAPGAS